MSSTPPPQLSLPSLDHPTHTSLILTLFSYRREVIRKDRISKYIFQFGDRWRAEKVRWWVHFYTIIIFENSFSIWSLRAALLRSLWSIFSPLIFLRSPPPVSHLPYDERHFCRQRRSTFLIHLSILHVTGLFLTRLPVSIFPFLCFVFPNNFESMVCFLSMRCFRS